MSNITAFTITRAITPQRLDLLEQTIKGGRETAGMDFEWRVHCLTDESAAFMYSIGPALGIKVIAYNDNVGQHVITNNEINLADSDGYDKLLRLDDDVKFLTKRWLYKLDELSDKLGPTFIVSPRISGLENPPPVSDLIDFEGVKIKLALMAMGGICRLHMLETLTNVEHRYVSDVRHPLGFGDATGLYRWCETGMEKGVRIWLAYLEDVRVKHALGTAKQRESDPAYHANHGLFQILPYIPVLGDKCE